jgi:hypothetical protein
MAIVAAVVCGLAITWAIAGFGLHLSSPRSCSGGGWRSSRNRVKETAFATSLYQLDNGPRCPTRDDLVNGKYVTRGGLVDAWGTSITFHCTPGYGAVVRSAGPDHLFHTDDDITAGEP